MNKRKKHTKSPSTELLGRIRRQKNNQHPLYYRHADTNEQNRDLQCTAKRRSKKYHSKQ